MSKTAMKHMGSSTSSSGAAGAAGGEEPLVLDREYDGLALVPRPTPLKRLNYFDGQFLRADDLRVEQDYLRELAFLGNRAGGSGVVSGLDVTAERGKLSLSAGLAIDPRGRVLYLPHGATVDLQQLIAASRPAPQSSSTGPGGAPGFEACEATAEPPQPVRVGATDLYQITLGPADALCGQADVYGKLCEDACASTTARPYRMDGVVLRAVPLSLPDARCTMQGLTRRHRRSQVASAWYALERARLGDDMAGARLRLDLWCLGATAESGSTVPLAVVSVSGGALEWVDEWCARRERMQDPPLRYWQWQTGMRPLAVFWAQVLQFQCQLHEVLSGRPAGTGDDDPCAGSLRLLGRAERMLADLERQLADARRAAELEDLRDSPAGGLQEIEIFRPAYLTRIADFKGEVISAVTSAKELAETRVLVDGGIVELPPAGWLPVVPGALDVNTQVKRLLGEGVDLRFCIVRPDYVPHAFEEAQHLERICLLEGLKDPKSKPQVDILVPGGVRADSVQEAGRSFEVALRFFAEGRDFRSDDDDDATVGVPTSTLNHDPSFYSNRFIDSRAAPPAVFTGAGRADPLAGGQGGAVRFAGQARTPDDDDGRLRYSFGSPLNTLRGIFTPERDGEGGVYARQQVNTIDEIVGVKGTATAVVPPSLWTSMTCEANPFALEPGESTDVRMELAYAESTLRRVLGGEMTLRGELYCDRGGRGGATMGGRLKGSLERRRSDGVPFPVLAVNLEVSLATRALSTGATAVTARLTADDGGGAEVVVRWGSEPLLATGALVGIEPSSPPSSPPGGERRALAAATARENPRVLDAANPYHVTSVQALAVLEKALREPGFKRYAERLLFPPPRPKDASVVRATRDWVLFHRRRVSTCDCCPEAAATAFRYRVYHLRVPALSTLEAIRRILRDPDRAAVRPVEVYPTFIDDSDQMQTAPGQVAVAWKAANPGTELLYGAVAGTGEGAATPDALLLGRLDRLASVVEETTPGDDPVLEVLHALAPEFRAEGADGVMVLVTAEAATDCHEVFMVGALPGGTTLFNFLEGAVGRNAVQAALQRLQCISLGTVRFAEGNATPGAGMSQVAAKWSGQVSAAVTISPDLGDRAALRRQQADGIVDELGGGPDSQHLVNVLTQSPPWDHCPVITVLAPRQEQQTTTLARLVVQRRDAAGLPILQTNTQWTVEFADDDTLVGGVNHALDNGLVAILGSEQAADANTSPRAAESGTGPPKRAQTLLNALREEQVKRGMSLVKASATAGSLAPNAFPAMYDEGGIAVRDLIVMTVRD